MARSGKANQSVALKYRQVALSGLRHGRKGKHNDLVNGILTELEVLPPGSALEIPLGGVAIGLANIRSAVHRGATSRGLEIETLADDRNFYVFRKQVG